MCSDVESPLYFGAEKHNSFTAELQANVMARLWLLQSGVSESIKICFLYDNQAAADAIVGKSVSRTNCIMCKFGLAVDRLCNKLYTSISHHIHSHDQHPWNELADSICTFVIKRPVESRVRWTPISPLCQEKAYCIDIASCMQNPFFVDSVSKDSDIPMTRQIALSTKYLAEKIDTHGAHEASTSKSLPIKVVQYNVQTFKDESDEIDLYARFMTSKCAIICIQENRKTYSGIKDMYGYFRCIAAGHAGSHGVEIAISKSCPFATDADGNNIFIEREHVSIVFSDPRGIIVRVCSKALDFYISSAHAPFLQSTTDHKKWWEGFKNQIKNHCRFNKPVLIGIDINCQIYDSELFGTWGLGPKGGKHPANFTTMSKCVSELGITFPAGDISKHSNPSEYGTYNPTVGNSTIVIDQIGTIGHIQVLPGSLCTAPDLTRALQVGKDHIPIVAKVLIQTSDVSCHHVRRRVVGYDLGKLNDTECAEAFRDKLKQFPVVGVEVENSTHCHLIQNYLHEALLECFPKSGTKKKKKYITDMYFFVYLCRESFMQKTVKS